MTRARLLMGVALVLAGCSRPLPTQMPEEAGPAPAVCRIGPDGGRPAKDRAVADRGIGGTGAPSRVADRGIGGTGIIGVITGFASVCVAGEEVALPPGVPTRMDEGAAQLDDLRAGQVVALEAAGSPGGLEARRIMVRHAVIGPVEQVGPGTMWVAGQMVVVSGATGSAVGAKPGQWVAVSGLPQGASTIVATRIDPAPTGPVLVRGELVRIYGATRIGSLPVQLPPGFNRPGGFPIVVTGRLRNGALIAESAAQDLANESPSAYFGPSVHDFIIEGAVAVLAGGYLVNRDFVAGGGFGAGGGRERAIVRYTRGVSGLVATGLHDGTAGAGLRSGQGGFSAAPTVPSGSGRGGGDPGNAGIPGGGFGRGGTGTGQPQPGFGAGSPGSAPDAGRVAGPGRR